MKSRLLSMLVTGLVLAVSLLAAVQITQSIRDRNSGQNDVQLSQNEQVQSVVPIVIGSVSAGDDDVSITGSAQADTAISVLNFGNSIRQIKSDGEGAWVARIPVKRDERYKLEFIQFVGEGQPIRADETVFHIPAPPLDDASADQSPRALVMVTAPGGPSRIFQSPFRGLPTSGAVSMGSIDYDDSGGVIFSGTSELAGRIRLFANNTMVGDPRVEANGRWYAIAADTLPSGTIDIRAELITEQGSHSSVQVSFDRLRSQNEIDEEQVEVIYRPYSWQIRRSLYGGGNQYTAIFAPENAEPIVSE